MALAITQPSNSNPVVIRFEGDAPAQAGTSQKFTLPGLKPGAKATVTCSGTWGGATVSINIGAGDTRIVLGENGAFSDDLTKTLDMSASATLTVSIANATATTDVFVDILA